MKTLNNVKLLPYSSNSKGAKRLAEALGITMVDRDNQTVNENDIVINWGNSSENLQRNSNIVNWVNVPQAVDLSIDKYHCFEALKAAGVPVPSFFTDVNEAATHLVSGGKGIVIRDNVRGMNGDGISYAFDVLGLSQAPLYTSFFPHECEVRVHVVGCEVVELHDKTVAGFKGTSSGAAYSLTDDVRAMLSSTALQAVSAVELDIAAVDILWSEAKQSYVVLEINTAPTMVNGTLTAYNDAIRNWLGEEPEVEEPKAAPVEPKASSEAKASPKASPKASGKASDETVDAQERVEAILDNPVVAASPKASPKASASEPKASPKASEAKASPKASEAPKASEEEVACACTELMVLESESVSLSEYEVVVVLLENAVASLNVALGMLNNK